MIVNGASFLLPRPNRAQTRIKAEHMTVLFSNGTTNPMLPTTHKPLHEGVPLRPTHGSTPRALVVPIPAMVTSPTDTMGMLGLTRDSTTLLRIPRRCITT